MDSKHIERSKNFEELNIVYNQPQCPKAEFRQSYQQIQQKQTEQHPYVQLQLLQQQTQEQQPSLLSSSELANVPKRSLYSIKEQEETCIQSAKLCITSDAEYKVEDDQPENVTLSAPTEQQPSMQQKYLSEREHIYELFHPWALKTYGDQAKTKTITMRKKARILKALEGKEHSRPDSSKFRFWVKSKAFTTTRPEGFEEVRGAKKLPPNAVLSDNPSEVDLFVSSTTKDLGKRIYRKVAVVEEFFDIIYNVHMELGGRNGMHAGQKRTYRIITETYAFLPREAVTRFLSTCPECKKNLRAFSPTTLNQIEEQPNESSLEEVLNYSSHTESSLEAGPAVKTSTKSVKPKTGAIIQRTTNQNLDAKIIKTTEIQLDISSGHTNPTAHEMPTTFPRGLQTSKKSLTLTTEVEIQKNLPVSVPKIHINPNLQRPITPPTVQEPVSSIGFMYRPPLNFDINTLKSHENLLRYYEFMHRFYTTGFIPTIAHSAAVTTASIPTTQLPVIIPPVYSTSTPKSNLKPEVVETSVNTDSPIYDTYISKIKHTQIDHSDDDDRHEITHTSKKFKTSPDTVKDIKAQTLALLNLPKPKHNTKPIFSNPTSEKTLTPTQTSAINLSKNFSYRSSCSPLSFALPVTCATSVKLEEVNTGSNKEVELRIPQLLQSLPTTLPPLDLERLKPITSTYLQLTRSMGLSDEDALRFDNLVSKDFKYSL
ncbi:uncharacterized protein LOC119688374 [Teleopsis dalmanni]|uniref:uncharacterized protein LOC119688374 n=1 Tax=Teleopsis dalmanni TaxID=139649 RepID=UPI0018CD4FFE|nr:uncharacterized protein LOC119688374 [Teleopsis dalmanni]